MHQTTTASGGGRAPAPRGDQGRKAGRAHNTKSFADRIGSLRKDFPGLRVELQGGSPEWFIRMSRPLACEGLEIAGSLTVDMPLDEDAAALLDAMAAADDPSLGRAELAAAYAEDVAYLSRRLQGGVEHLHRLARRDIDAGGIRPRDYLRALSGRVGRAVVELYPAWSQDEGRDYRPGQHVRDVVKAAAGEALREARAGGGKRGRGRRGDGRSGPPARPPGRPMRMRRWSPLYE